MVLDDHIGSRVADSSVAWLPSLRITVQPINIIYNIFA